MLYVYLMKKEIPYVNHFVKTKIMVFGTILYLKGILTCTSAHLCVYLGFIVGGLYLFEKGIHGRIL